MTLTVKEYANGYTHDDICDGDVDYQVQDEFVHEFDDIDEMIDFFTGYSEHAIRGETSCATVTVFEAADMDLWISDHETEFKHACYVDPEDGRLLGGDWFTDRSWHFDLLTNIERTRLFLAIQPNVYGMKPYWK